jgi:hypothetical protein
MWPGLNGPGSRRRRHASQSEPGLPLDLVAFQSADVADCGNSEIETAAVDMFQSGCL